MKRIGRSPRPSRDPGKAQPVSERFDTLPPDGSAPLRGPAHLPGRGRYRSTRKEDTRGRAAEPSRLMPSPPRGPVGIASEPRVTPGEGFPTAPDVLRPLWECQVAGLLTPLLSTV